jgi:hypothetical protein
MKRLLVLGLLLSQPAWAEWTAFFETKGSAFYMDYATIRKTESGRFLYSQFGQGARSNIRALQVGLELAAV